MYVKIILLGSMNLDFMNVLIVELRLLLYTRECGILISLSLSETIKGCLYLIVLIYRIFNFNFICVR